MAKYQSLFSPFRILNADFQNRSMNDKEDKKEECYKARKCNKAAIFIIKKWLEYGDVDTQISIQDQAFCNSQTQR